MLAVLLAEDSIEELGLSILDSLLSLQASSLNQSQFVGRLYVGDLQLYI